MGSLDLAFHLGPGGKTVFPGRAEAKIDLRLVPDMTRDEAVAKLKAHLAICGFGDIEVNVSGGYGPTRTDDNSALIKAEKATLTSSKIPQTMPARSAGSWLGVVVTGPPLGMAAVQLGGGRSGGAHAPDEWLLIQSSNPKLFGFDQQATLFADFLYEVARTGKGKRYTAIGPLEQGVRACWARLSTRRAGFGLGDLGPFADYLLL